MPSKLGFGRLIQKQTKLWTYDFDITEGALDIETLVNDFDLIPIITQLDETAEFKMHIFLPKMLEL